MALVCLVPPGPGGQLHRDFLINLYYLVRVFYVIIQKTFSSPRIFTQTVKFYHLMCNLTINKHTTKRNLSKYWNFCTLLVEFIERIAPVSYASQNTLLYFNISESLYFRRVNIRICNAKRTYNVILF